MNDGAKVFEVGVPLLESVRCRTVVVILLLGDNSPASEEMDWFLVCGGLCVEDNGEDMIMDFGLPLGLLGAGDGEPVLEKGLLRFEAMFEVAITRRSRKVQSSFDAKKH